MAQRQRRRVGGVGGRGRGGETESHLHHLGNLCLVRAAPSGDGILHLVRRVLDDLAPARRGCRQGEPAGLADAHRRPYVDLEEHLLDSDDVGTEFGDQCHELSLQAGESLGKGIGSPAGVRMTPSARTDGRPGPTPVERRRSHIG